MLRTLPTCVGLRYGHPLFTDHDAFLGSVARHYFTPTGAPLHPSAYQGCGFAYTPNLRTWTSSSLSWLAAPPASRLGLQVGGAGILTGCPSATPFGLTLGPAFPYADLPSVGSLRLPGSRFLTWISLLMPGFSLPCSPSPLTGVTSPHRERSPTTHMLSHMSPWLRYCALAPLYLRRRTARPVSCYALLRGWLLLSQPPGCLSSPTSFLLQHLAQISGP